MSSPLPPDASRLWHTTSQLIRFDTESRRSNRECSDWLANRLETLGFRTSMVSDTVDGQEFCNVIAIAGPPAPEGGLMVSGHIDIVPFADQPGWMSDPLDLIRVNDDAVGRGITDMKGFIAQLLLACERMDLKKLARPLVIVLTCQEELASLGARRLIPRLPEILGETPQPRIALFGEPTGFAPLRAHKAYGFFCVSLRGHGGHSSRPDLGANAIEAMRAVLAAVDEWNLAARAAAPDADALELFPEFPWDSLNCGHICGGLAPNMIAERCDLTISFRLLPGRDPGRLIEDLRERFVRKLTEISPRAAGALSVQLTLGDMEWTGGVRAPATTTFAGHLRDVSPEKPMRGAAFATDAGFFEPIGMACYIWGPGLLEQAHKPNESMPLANLYTGLDKLHDLLQRQVGR